LYKEILNACEITTKKSACIKRGFRAIGVIFLANFVFSNSRG